MDVAIEEYVDTLIEKANAFNILVCSLTKIIVYEKSMCNILVTITHENKAVNATRIYNLLKKYKFKLNSFDAIDGVDYILYYCPFSTMKEQIRIQNLKLLIR